jgi:hypothetical protein
VKIYHKILVAAVVPVAALASMAAATATGPAHPARATYQTRVLASGKNLHHTYLSKVWKAEPLSQPDDITWLRGELFVGFQNGVGPQGQASADGNTDSTVVEFTPSGRAVRQWDVAGHADGVTADPLTGQVIVTVNEDASSSLYVINPRTGEETRYRYNERLPHNGGTDAITVYHGELLISASAPGTTGAAAPRASYPAVYVVRLNPCSRVATVRPLYYDEASAIAVNGKDAGKTVRLALTDPDSSEVTPAGDFALDSQGDQQLIFYRSGRLRVLNLSRSVDDSAWITPGRDGRLYTTDNGADTVDVITGPLRPGTVYSAVTPCGANSAPATCPGPGYPADYLGSLNPATGALTAVPLRGPVVHPQGLLYVS